MSVHIVDVIGMSVSKLAPSGSRSGRSLRRVFVCVCRQRTQSSTTPDESELFYTIVRVKWARIYLRVCVCGGWVSQDKNFKLCSNTKHKHIICGTLAHMMPEQVRKNTGVVMSIFAFPTFALPVPALSLPIFFMSISCCMFECSSVFWTARISSCERDVKGCE